MVEPFARLVAERKLLSYRHNGFWLAMDTFKDKMIFDHMYEQGTAPWQVWKARGNVAEDDRHAFGGDGR